MEIHASCVFDYPSIEALTHASMFRKRNPLNRLFLCSGLTIFVWALHFLLFFCFGSSGLIPMIIVSCVLTLFMMFLIFAIPKIRYNALGKLKGTQNHYTFTEQKFSVVSHGAVHESSTEYNYATLVMAIETSGYVFLFISQNQALIIDKATFVGGTASDLKALIKPLIKKKYFTCTY